MGDRNKPRWSKERKAKNKPKRRSSKSNPNQNKNYFYAYSSNMMFHYLFKCFSSLSLVLDTSTFSLDNEFFLCEMPQTTGDVQGRYGALVIGNNYVRRFLRSGLKFKAVEYGYKQYLPIENEICFLSNINGRSHELKPYANSYFENSSIIPYRTPIDIALVDELVKCGYQDIIQAPLRKIISIHYHSLIGELYQERKNTTFGVEQEPMFYRITKKSDKKNILITSDYLPQITSGKPPEIKLLEDCLD